MSVLNPADTLTIRGVTLRRDPAREPCFTIVYLHSEMRLSDDMSAVSRRERLHREANNEVQSLEIAAQCLADFQEAPWELRMQLARQCWDETRHAHLRYRRLAEIGGYKGEFPIMNREWGVVCLLDSLAARLAIQNRTFEGGALDALRKAIDAWKQGGDEKTAEMIETVLADEIQHVRFANQWLRRMTRDDPRIVLEVARALDYVKRLTAVLTPRAGDVSTNGLDLTSADHDIPPSAEERREAEFTEEEIAALRQ